MSPQEARSIRTGTVLEHNRKGRVIARGPVWEKEGTVWVDTPEDPLCPDIPYNANIAALHFAD